MYSGLPGLEMRLNSFLYDLYHKKNVHKNYN